MLAKSTAPNHGARRGAGRGPDWGLDKEPDGGQMGDQTGCQTGCSTGPDGVPDGSHVIGHIIFECHVTRLGWQGIILLPAYSVNASLTLRKPYCVVTEGSVTSQRVTKSRHRYKVTIDNPGCILHCYLVECLF
jgi:hypothetical protein